MISTYKIPESLFSREFTLLERSITATNTSVTLESSSLLINSSSSCTVLLKFNPLTYCSANVTVS